MNPYLSLAKQAIENYIEKKTIISPTSDLPADCLAKRAGTFVTIRQNEELKGCLGTYLPSQENIAKEIISNAVAAATQDYRFSPIKREDLPNLSYTVYILNEPELVRDTKELDPKKYGVIVKAQVFSPSSDVIFNPSPTVEEKTGLLLPGLEGVDTPEQQIFIACQKGGIDPTREKITLYRFSVEKHGQ